MPRRREWRISEAAAVRHWISSARLKGFLKTGPLLQGVGLGIDALAGAAGVLRPAINQASAGAQHLSLF
jgi:hypothetical protein